MEAGKKKNIFIVFIILLLALIGVYYYAAYWIHPLPQPKPGPITEESKYEYYILLDEETGNVLGYISSVKVSTGDEYITSDNKRYVVVKLEENRAYMRNFGPK